MGERLRSGDTKKCPKCSHLAMLFSEQALKLIIVTIYPEGSSRGEACEPAWVCSNCGSYEPVAD